MKKLYDQLIEDGEYTGSFEEFKAQYGDAKKSKVLFDGFTEEGKYTGSFEEFNAQYEFPSAKKEGPADVDPAVAPSNDTGSNLVDGSSEFQDPLSDFYVTASDLRSAGDEEDAITILNKRFAPIGISSSEGTSFGSTNALNFKNSIDPKEAEMGSLSNTASKLFGDPTKIFSAVAIGLDKTDEELTEAAIEINAYIKEKADPSYLSKAKQRSGSAYEKYAASLQAPVLLNKDLEALAKEAKVSNFSKVLRSETGSPSQGDYRGSGLIGIPATKDNFSSKGEFQAYKQWKKDGYIQDFSPQELEKFDKERKQKYALNKSAAFANNSSEQERMDVLALVSEDEKKLSDFTQQKKEYYKSEDALKDSIEKYELNPSADNFAIASTIEIDYLKKQGEIQSLQNKLNEQGTFDKAKAVVH